MVRRACTLWTQGGICLQLNLAVATDVSIYGAHRSCRRFGMLAACPA